MGPLVIVFRGNNKAKIWFTEVMSIDLKWTKRINLSPSELKKIKSYKT